jgi:Na+/H+ antiporter NhaC
MPVVVAFLISAAVALFSNRKASLQDKIDVFCKGAGDSNIILMVVIFLLAGGFSGVAKAMGGVDATVNLSLSILPANLLVVGLFIIGCFISVSMGTSVGTISALAPIGLGIADRTGMSLPLITGAIVGGAMFGYRSIGNIASPIIPPSTMIMEITEESTGRSINVLIFIRHSISLSQQHS